MTFAANIRDASDYRRVGLASCSNAPGRPVSAISLALAVALLVAPAPALAASSRCEATDDQLVAAIREVHEKQRNVGLQAAISRDGMVVFSTAMGEADRDRGIAVTRQTRFPVASITKAFTGLATLHAVAAGKLDLESPIQRYVPEFPIKPELTVTPRRLAAHRAGLRHWGPERDALYTRRFSRLAEILPLFMNDPLLSGAGQKYQYSSYGYNLLGLAVERATGVEFTRYVQRRIIDPLKLTHTGFDDARRPVLGTTKLYSAYDMTKMTDKGYAEIAPNAPLIEVAPRDYSHNMAGGNMSTTAEDMVRLGGALLRPGFLPKREYDLLFVQPVFEGGESAMSFGFFTTEPVEERRLSISGANPGMQAGLMVFPARKLAVSVLSNSWGFDSRSGDMVNFLPKRLAELCAPRAASAAPGH